MGIAASQARYLYLTARQINVEFEGQQLNQARTNLANEQANLTRELNSVNVPTAKSQYALKSQIAQWKSTDGPRESDYTDKTQYEKDLKIWQAYLSAGGTEEDKLLVAYNQATTQYTNDKAEYDQYMVEIESRSQKIQQQDQVLELQLRQLDTERNTITTELDSVKKVLDKNIEQVFKTFQS